MTIIDPSFYFADFPTTFISRSEWREELTEQRFEEKVSRNNNEKIKFKKLKKKQRKEICIVDDFLLFHSSCF